MTVYLDPTNDIAFKKVFGDKARLKKFLNTIMRLPSHMQIEDLEYISQELVPDLGQLKRGIVDIRCKDLQGNSYIVEMQNGWAQNFIKRVQFYGSHAITSQVERGKTHADIAPVILILILSGFTALKDNSLDVVTFHRTVEVESGKSFLKDLSYVFVEVDRFNKPESELDTFEDYWLYYLSKWSNVKEPPKSLKDDDILSAYDAIDKFNWSAEQLDAYLKAKLALDTENMNLKAEFEKGEAKGKAEGKAERNIEIAKKLISKGNSIDDIIDITGLSRDEILKIK